MRYNPTSSAIPYNGYIPFNSSGAGQQQQPQPQQRPPAIWPQATNTALPQMQMDQVPQPQQQQQGGDGGEKENSLAAMIKGGAGDVAAGAGKTFGTLASLAGA